MNHGADWDLRLLADPARLYARHALQRAHLGLLSAAVPHAPTFDDCAVLLERAREQLELMEEDLSDLPDSVRAHLAGAVVGQSLPGPRSWTDAVAAMLTLCLAVKADARQQLDSLGPSPARIRALASYAEHTEAVRASLRELVLEEGGISEVLDERVSEWLERVGMLVGDAEHIARLRLEILSSVYSDAGHAPYDEGAHATAPSR